MFEELMDKTLREVLEDYSLIWNYECGFIYGIIPNDILEEVVNKYDKEEYEESFVIEPIISIELLTDPEEELISMKKAEKIMKGLGIKPKKSLNLNTT